MSKPKSSIRDYGYNPNQYDSIEDMMNSVPDATVTNQGVIRKHSEFQSPNEADDYQKMDSSYDSFPGGPDWKGPYPGAPYRPDYGEACLQLWKKLFPGWTSGKRILDASERAKFNQYAAKCPANVIWMKCCAEDKTNFKSNKTASKIVGPDSVNHDDTKEYKLVPPLPAGCGEWWGADYGRCVGGTYTAPSSGTTDRIYVDPLIPEAGVKQKHCAEKKIKLGASGTCASESIGISGTTQMSVGDTKTLTVLNPVVGKTYTWVISAGGGGISPSTGTSTTYTAPGTNANCASNPTIQLKVGANVCDSVLLVVTNPAVSGQAGYSDYDPCSKTIDVGFPGKCGAGRGVKAIYCSGSFGAQSWYCFGGSYGEYDCGSPQLDWVLSFCGCPGPGSVSYTDMRTAEMKANGCCPYQLM